MVELSAVEKIKSFSVGNYSVTGFWIVLERKMASHLLQMILPSAMFVIVSWISFLMPLDSGERASLLVTVLLVLVSMFLSVLSTAPKASTLTAMEVWVVSCLILVFFAVAEYGLLLHTTSKEVSKTSNSQDLMILKKKSQSIHKLDKIAIVVLPVLFIIFNIMYWSVYTT